jgi:hypothetical protein
VGNAFLISGTVLFTVSVLARSDWLTAITCLVAGVWLECSAPPAGVINITLAFLLLLVLWRRRRRRRHGEPAAAGAKSRALRDALARRMRDLSVPVPA